MVGLKSIDAFAEKIHKERRFADLLFAPISNQISINGNYIQVPLMEVQSNAIQLFFEGDYHLNGNSNFWISLPLNNLKKPQLNTIPPKTGYALAGNKVFLEIQSNVGEAPKLKFRTSKRKFYRKRRMLKQFRMDKREDRQIRKAAKRAGKERAY